MAKNKKIKNEWAGAGINGAPSFQGFAYGYGGRAQLAGPPRPLPDDFKKIVDQIVSDEIEDFFEGKPDVFTERNQSDQLYRDLPGFPRMNTLVAKKNYVPIDPSEIDNQDFLGPTVNGIALNDISGNTINNWKATSPEKRGKLTIDINALVKKQELSEGMISSQGRSIWGTWNPNQLVAVKDWQQETEKNKFGDEEAKNPIGSMGVIKKPIRFAPNSAENQVKITSETSNKTLINTEGNVMSIQKLIETIKKIVKKELDEAQELGAEEAWRDAFDGMLELIKKYGGKDFADWERVVPEKERENYGKIANIKINLSKSFHGTKSLKNVKQQETLASKLAALRAMKKTPQQQKILSPDELARRNAALSAMKKKYSAKIKGFTTESALKKLIETILEESLSKKMQKK